MNDSNRTIKSNQTNEWRSRARDRTIDRSNDRAFVAFLVRVPPVEREVARRRVTIDRSVGTRPEPNRTDGTGRDGTRRDAHPKARKTTAKPNPMKVAMAFPNEPMRAPGTRRRRHPADSQSAAVVAGPPTHALLARRKSARLSFDAKRKGTRTEVR